MKRYSGYLTSTKGGRSPANMGALALSVVPAGPGERIGSRPIRAGEWTLLLWRVRHGIVKTVDCHHGQDVSSLWGILRALVSRRGRWVVLSPRLLQTLTVLDTWRSIDAGLWKLERKPLLLADPPTALALSVPGLPGKLVLYDTANFGAKIGEGREAALRVMKLAQSMCQALEEIGAGPLKATAGAQTLHGYRRSFMDSTIETSCRPAAISLGRAACHGGRAECFRLGRIDGPIYHLDYSGFYPSIMATIPVPVRLRWSGSWAAPALEHALKEPYSCCAQVRLRTEEPAYPAGREGLTVYPVGTWWTTLAGPDLAEALRLDQVEEVGRWACWDCEPALARYARTLLALRDRLRRDGSTDAERWSKALAVSLVGKFAARDRRWVDRPHLDLASPWCAERYTDRTGRQRYYRSIAGVVQEEIVGGETAYSCPWISAWIYSEGRQRLWRTILQAGREDCYYCYTDSLFVNNWGRLRLKTAGLLSDGSEPGKLAVRDVWPWIEILGIGHYRVPGKTVCMGASISEGEGQGGGWYGERVMSAIAGNEPHAPRPIQFRGAREVCRPYRHGQRGPDGRVEPWRLGSES